MPDIRETLAQLDRRLADLGHQITDLMQGSEPAPPPPPPAHRMPPPPDLQAFDPDPGLVRHGSGSSEARGRAAVQDLSELGAQLEQLLTLRERLVDDARNLLQTYERQLQELEAHEPTELRAVLASLVAAAPGSPGEGDFEVTGARPAYFEGTVALMAVGVQRIQTIQVMEDALSRARHVEQVYIRRWHAGQITFELTLGSTVELLGELNRVLPFPFAVRSASSQEIVIAVEGQR